MVLLVVSFSFFFFNYVKLCGVFKYLKLSGGILRKFKKLEKWK